MPRPGRLALTALLLALLPLAAAAEVQLQVEGVPAELRASLRAALGIANLPENPRPQLIRRRHARASTELRSALKAFGYYEPRIEAQLRLDSAEDWQARYRIEPGPRWVWEAAHITAAEDFSAPWLERLRRQAATLEGRPLDHREYRQLKSALLAQAQGAGYLDVELAQAELRVNLDTRKARAVLKVEPGPQYRFGQVRIEQSILDPDFLQRFNPIREGSVFDPGAVLDLRLRLFDLDYFDDIVVSTERAPDSGRIDVLLDTVPKPSQRWEVGAGWGTDTGPRVLGALDLRHLNRRGHRVESEARLSEVKIDLSARYVIPTGPEPAEGWSLRTQRREEKLGDTETTTLLTGVGRTRADGPRLWNFYVNYEGERFAFADGETKTDLVLPGVSLTLRGLDDLLLPRRGYTLFVDVHGSHDALLSTTTLLQSQLQLRWIMPLSQRSRLILRGQAGANWVAEEEEVPVSQRFFAGGDGSIRGYDYRQVAPRNDAGEVVGGRYLQTASIEVDRLIWGNYGLAAFYDTGSASAGWLEDLVSAAGLGFRWATPVGMLRVDLAHPLNGDDGLQLHIGIGGEL